MQNTLYCSLSVAGRAGRWASTPTSLLCNSRPSQAKSQPFPLCIHFRLLLPFMHRGRGCDFMHEASESRGAQSSHPGGLEPPPCAPLSSQEGCDGQPEEGRDATLQRKGQMGEEVNLARHTLYVKHSPKLESHTHSPPHTHTHVFTQTGSPPPTHTHSSPAGPNAGIRLMTFSFSFPRAVSGTDAEGWSQETWEAQLQKAQLLLR